MAVIHFQMGGDILRMIAKDLLFEIVPGGGQKKIGGGDNGDGDAGQRQHVEPDDALKDGRRTFSHGLLP